MRWEEWEAGNRLLVWDTRFNNVLCEGDRVVVVGRTAGDGVQTALRKGAGGV